MGQAVGNGCGEGVSCRVPRELLVPSIVLLGFVWVEGQPINAEGLFPSERVGGKQVKYLHLCTIPQASSFL